MHNAAAATFSRAFFEHVADQAGRDHRQLFSQAFHYARTQLKVEVVPTSHVGAADDSDDSGTGSGSVIAETAVAAHREASAQRERSASLKFGIADPDDAFLVDPSTTRREALESQQLSN